MAKQDNSDIYDIGSSVHFYNSESNTITLVHSGYSSNYFVIDGIAAQVWKLIDGKKSTELILNEICSQLPHYQNELIVDVKNFLKNLADKDFIEKMN